MSEIFYICTECLFLGMFNVYSLFYSNHFFVSNLITFNCFKVKFWYDFRWLVFWFLRLQFGLTHRNHRLTMYVRWRVSSGSTLFSFQLSSAALSLWYLLLDVLERFASIRPCCTLWVFYEFSILIFLQLHYRRFIAFNLFRPSNVTVLSNINASCNIGVSLF